MTEKLWCVYYCCWMDLWGGWVSECVYSLTPWRFLTFLHFQCVTTKSRTDTLEVCVCIFRSKFLSLCLSLSCICTNIQLYLKISPFRLMWSCLFVCGSCSEWSPSGSHTWLWLACCDSSSPHHTLSDYPQPPALQLSSVTVAATVILRPHQYFSPSAVCCILTQLFHILCRPTLLHFFLNEKIYGV